jgi:NADP-dependent 3-hydroxy acid dehydrogenase YdfG
VILAKLHASKQRLGGLRWRAWRRRPGCVTLDVAERKQLREAIQKTVHRFGRRDVMFNNAGLN